MELTQDVLNSPAVPVLCGLEYDGLDLAVVNGRLRVWPVERLTVEHEQIIRQHRDALVTLVRICDERVQERLVVFKKQLGTVPAGTTPDFVFQRGTPYAKAVCFSCGVELPEPRYGRCWCCSLAWRMAAVVPIPAEAAAYDGARVVA